MPSASTCIRVSGGRDQATAIAAVTAGSGADEGDQGGGSGECVPVHYDRTVRRQRPPGLRPCTGTLWAHSEEVAPPPGPEPRPCRAADAEDALRQRGQHASHGVSAQDEIESKTWKQIIMFQSQALSSRRCQRGFDRVNPHCPTMGIRQYSSSSTFFTFM